MISITSRQLKSIAYFPFARSRRTWSSRHFSVLACLLLSGISGTAQAEQWQLEKNGEDYQISIQSNQGDRLILNHEGEDTRFIINVPSKHKQPDSRQMLQRWFDKDHSIIESEISRIDRYTYQIKLSKSQKNDFIQKMINYVDLYIRYPIGEHSYREVRFSLIGFTAVLNDMLIAHEIGHLDPEWLNENHKTRELMCYYAANFSVLAMLHRRQGLSYRQSLKKFKSQYADALNDVISDIVKQVYNMPAARLPRDPRGDKYGIFKRCMENFNR